MLSFVGAVLLIILGAGCSLESTPDDGPFKNAPAQIQQEWHKAVELEKANEYMSAAETYDQLLHMQLTDQQSRKVELTLSKMYTRVLDAAAKGDPKAKETLDTINANKNGVIR